MRQLVVIALLYLSLVAAKPQALDSDAAVASAQEREQETYADSYDVEEDGDGDDAEDDAEDDVGQNIAGIGETPLSCEYSCPRYYRPVCARRNGQLVTYATLCEYHNQLRCANVARRQGLKTAQLQLLYKDECRESAR